MWATILDWRRRYRANLVAYVESCGPNWWLSVKGPLVPWIIPLLVGGVFCWAFGLNELGRALVIIPTGAISLAGMIYAGCVVMSAGIRSDRLRRAERETRP